METPEQGGFFPDPWHARREASARRSLPRGFDPDAWRTRREFARSPHRLPQPEFKCAERAGAAAERVFRSLGLPQEDAAAMRIESAWPGAVGPDVAAHARPGPVEGGTLTVFVKGSVWLSELRREARTALLPKLREAMSRDGGTCPVRAIRVAPDPGGAAW